MSISKLLDFEWDEERLTAAASIAIFVHQSRKDRFGKMEHVSLKLHIDLAVDMYVSATVGSDVRRELSRDVSSLYHALFALHGGDAATHVTYSILADGSAHFELSTETRNER